MFGEDFKKIIDFINGDESIETKDIIVSLNQDVIFDEDRKTGKRVQTHQVVFYGQNDNIISEITLLGGNVYRLVLGKIPKEWSNANFGCGHFFNPFNKKISRMTQNEAKKGSLDEIIPTYGLFMRF